MKQDISERPDEEIVALVQSGDIEQFGELIRRYEAKIIPCPPNPAIITSSRISFPPGLQILSRETREPFFPYS